MDVDHVDFSGTMKVTKYKVCVIDNLNDYIKYIQRTFVASDIGNNGRLTITQRYVNYL